MSWKDGSDMNHMDFMKLAIEVSNQKRQDTDHEEKPDPLVGVVIVKEDENGNKMYDTSFRSEGYEGDHAEFNLLYNRYKSEDLNGATLYVTLEPCSPDSRSQSVLSCSEVISKKAISKVYICMLDPNPEVYGQGAALLLKNRISIEMFPDELYQKFRKMNDKFVKYMESTAPKYSKILRVLKESDFDMNAIDKFMAHSKLPRYHDFIDEFYKNHSITVQNKKVLFHKEFEIAFQKNIGYKYISSKISFIDERDAPLESKPTVLIKPFIYALDELIKYLNKNFLAPGKTSDDKEPYNIQFEVIREAFVNALIHKDYDSDIPTILRIKDNELTISNPVDISSEKFNQIKNFETDVEPVNGKLCHIASRLNQFDMQGKGLQTIGSYLPKPVYSKLNKTLKITIKY